MDINILITPIAGGVIGYFTNYIAIKMLFRPYTEKSLFGVKLPFTLGLIPKEKPRIAKSLGKTIGTHLLNEDVVMDALTRDNVINIINDSTENILNKIKNENISITTVCKNTLKLDTDDVLEKFSDYITSQIISYITNENFKSAFLDIIYSKTTEYMQKPLCQMPYEKVSSLIFDTLTSILKDTNENHVLKENISSIVWKAVCSKCDDERFIDEIIPTSIQKDIKNFVSQKTPSIINALILATDDPEIEKILKRKISDITGPFMGIFIKSDDIYNKIISATKKYINNPKNMPEIENIVDKCIDKILHRTVGSVVTSITSNYEENVITNAVSFVLDEILSENNVDNIKEIVNNFFENNKNRSIFEILKCDDDKDKQLKEIISSLTDKILKELTESHIKNFTKSFVYKLADTNISTAISHIDENKIQKIKDIVIDLYKKCIKEVAPRFFNAFDIASVAEERISSFSMSKTEQIILEIADRELKSITAVGGILGFVIGFVPIIIELIS